MTIGERRVIGALGLVSIALNTAAFGLFVADVPALGDTSAAGYVSWIADHRVAILAGCVLMALAWTASVGFLMGLRARMRGLDADIGLAGVVVLFAVVATGNVAMQAAALLAGTGDGLQPDTAHLAVSVLLTTFAVSAAPTLLFVGGYARAIFRTGALPRWAGWGLLFVGLVHVGALLAVAQRGALSPNGVFAIGAPAVYEIWQALVAIELLRRTS